MPLELHLYKDLYTQLINQAQKTPTKECCGYLLGETKAKQNLVQSIYPIPNVHPNPKSFFAFSPTHQLQVFHYLKSNRALQIIGIYHSHPTSDPILSQTDQDFIFSPSQSNLIISLKNGIKVASYRIMNQKILKETVKIYEDVKYN